jgi:ATP-dependent protease ClpP protease subunit
MLVNNFLYTIDVESDEPIMLINKHIGYDEQMGQGIDGSTFQAELLRLDTMGKKRIQVWISSEGGMVMDGYKIYNAILKSKTKVDTYNVGIAASIAAVIFQAGRRRIMADYSLLMYHNPYGGESTELKRMRESIAVMVAERTENIKEDVLKIMDRTTWISASEALLSGFCDEVEYSKDVNIKHGNAKALWESGALIANSIINPKNKNTMLTNVANKLGLNPEANEAAVMAEISSILNKKMSLEEKFTKIEDEYTAAKEKCNELEAKMAEMAEELKEAENKKAEAEVDAKKIEAKNMVEGFVKAGKIKNESADKWIGQALVNFDTVKNLLEELPTNGKAAVISTNPVDNDAALTMVAAKAMQDVRNKFKI